MNISLSSKRYSTKQWPVNTGLSMQACSTSLLMASYASCTYRCVQGHRVWQAVLGWRCTDHRWWVGGTREVRCQASKSSAPFPKFYKIRITVKIRVIRPIISTQNSSQSELNSSCNNIYTSLPTIFGYNTSNFVIKSVNK